MWVLTAKGSRSRGIRVSERKLADLSGESASGETLMLIRDKKDFLLSAEDAAGMRYNMTVDAYQMPGNCPGDT